MICRHTIWTIIATVVCSSLLMALHLVCLALASYGSRLTVGTGKVAEEANLGGDQVGGRSWWQKHTQDFEIPFCAIHAPFSLRDFHQHLAGMGLTFQPYASCSIRTTAVPKWLLWYHEHYHQWLLNRRLSSLFLK